VSGLSIRLFTTRWKPAVLKGLGNGEVAAVFKIAAPSASTLFRVVAASIT
jgi:hypothetical protein